jgi:hypothetical protein
VTWLTREENQGPQLATSSQGAAPCATFGGFRGSPMMRCNDQAGRALALDTGAAQRTFLPGSAVRFRSGQSGSTRHKP